MSRPSFSPGLGRRRQRSIAVYNICELLPRSAWYYAMRLIISWLHAATLGFGIFCPGRPVRCHAVFRHLRVFNGPARARVDEPPIHGAQTYSYLSTLLARGVCRCGGDPRRDSADRCSSVSRAGHHVLCLRVRLKTG
jgi:hypothetical protein